MVESAGIPPDRGMAARSLLPLLLALLLVTAGSLLPRQTMAEPRAEAIIGGTIGSSSLFPAVALIYIDSSLCTGTLIDSEYILTAGHCAFDERGRVIKDMGDITIVLGEEIRGARSVHVHPQYNNQAPACSEGIPDASLIHLDEPIYTIAPIALADTPPAVGSSLLLAGYGMLGSGASGQNGFFPEEDTLSYGYTTVDQVTPTFVFWKYKSSRGGANTAGGDSGGPAFQTINDQLVLQAITCGGTGNAQYGTESFDTRVDILIDWISQYVSGISSSAPPSLILPSVITARAQRSMMFPVQVHGARPLRLTISGLPEGVSFRDGSIQGAPERAGTWPITISAENSFGHYSQTITLLVKPPDTIFRLTRATLQYGQSLNPGNLLLLRGRLNARHTRLLRNRFLTLQIGSYRRTFSISAKRRISSQAADSLKISSITSGRQSGRSTVDFRITIRSDEAFSSLDAFGFTSRASAPLGSRSILPVIFEFDGNRAVLQQALSLSGVDLRWHLVF